MALLSSQPLWIFMFFFLKNSSLLFSITRSSSFSQITSKKTRLCCCFFFLKVRAALQFLSTLSCILVAIPVDWIILHWYACGADRQSDGRCTVTWLPNFLGWIVYHISLSMVLRCARFACESSAKMKLSVNEPKLTGLCMGKEMCYYSTGLDFKICFRSEKLPGLSRNRPLAFKKLCHHYID